MSENHPEKMDAGWFFGNGFLVEQMPADTVEEFLHVDELEISNASECLAKEIAELHAAARQYRSRIQTLETDLKARDQSARAEFAQARESFEKAIGKMRAVAIQDAARIRELFDVTQALQTDLSARDQDARAARAETTHLRKRIEEENAELRADALQTQTLRTGLEKEIAELHAAAHQYRSQIQTLQTDLNARDQDVQSARAEFAQARENEKTNDELRLKAASRFRELLTKTQTLQASLKARDQSDQESAQLRESLGKENGELRAAMAAQIESVQRISTHFHQMGNVMLSSYGECYLDMLSAREETARVRECLTAKTNELRAARKDALEFQVPAALEILEAQTAKTTRNENFRDNSKHLGSLSTPASQTESVHEGLTPQKQSAAEAEQSDRPAQSSRMQQAGMQRDGQQNRFRQAEAATKNDRECDSEDDLPHAGLRPTHRYQVQSITRAASRGNRLVHLGSAAAATPVSQSPEETCAICLDPLPEHSHCGSVSEAQCNHQFHLDCLTEWLRTSSTCPVCSARVSARRMKRRKLAL